VPNITGTHDIGSSTFRWNLLHVETIVSNDIRTTDMGYVNALLTYLSKLMFKISDRRVRRLLEYIIIFLNYLLVGISDVNLKEVSLLTIKMVFVISRR
jgi:hypothetical protein